MSISFPALHRAQFDNCCRPWDAASRYAGCFRALRLAHGRGEARAIGHRSRAGAERGQSRADCRSRVDLLATCRPRTFLHSRRGCRGCGRCRCSGRCPWTEREGPEGWSAASFSTIVAKEVPDCWSRRGHPANCWLRRHKLWTEGDSASGALWRKRFLQFIGLLLLLVC